MDNFRAFLGTEELKLEEPLLPQAPQFFLFFAFVVLILHDENLVLF